MSGESQHFPYTIQSSNAVKIEQQPNIIFAIQTHPQPKDGAASIPKRPEFNNFHLLTEFNKQFVRNMNQITQCLLKMTRPQKKGILQVHSRDLINKKQNKPVSESKVKQESQPIDSNQLIQLSSCILNNEQISLQHNHAHIDSEHKPGLSIQKKTRMIKRSRKLMVSTQGKKKDGLSNRIHNAISDYFT